MRHNFVNPIKQHGPQKCKSVPVEKQATVSNWLVQGSDVTLDTVLTKQYRPFETIGTDTNVSSVASNGQNKIL